MFASLLNFNFNPNLHFCLPSTLGFFFPFHCVTIPCLQGYLSHLGDPAVTQDLLHRLRSATNMTDEIAALALLDRCGGLGMRCA